MSTAHSGPELVSSVPQSQLASELAQALLMDCMQITESFTSSGFGSSVGAHVMISLSRR